MKHPLRTFLFTLLLLPMLAKADTYVLKNGDKVEGTLVRETKDAYVVEVHLAPTIKDEREIPKDKVLRILKPEAGLAEFEQLRNLVPTPDGLKADDYKQRIDLMTQFIETFPSSIKVRKAMEMRDELRDEMRQVLNGSVKIAGVLYPASELRENAYELDARIAAREIKEMIAMRKHLDALRAYSDFQKDFSYTAINLDLMPLMRELINHHTAQASEWLLTYEERMEQRQKGLESMNHRDRIRSVQAIQEQTIKLKQEYLRQTNGRVGWVTVHPYSRESLEYTVQYSRTELRKMDNLLTKEFTDGGELYREMYKMKQAGAESQSMREKMRLAERLNIPDRYTNKFTLASGDL